MPGIVDGAVTGAWRQLLLITTPSIWTFRPVDRTLIVTVPRCFLNAGSISTWRRRVDADSRLTRPTLRPSTRTATFPHRGQVVATMPARLSTAPDLVRVA